MAQYKQSVSDLSLKSTWTCTYYIEVDWNNGIADETYCSTQSRPTTASYTQSFPLSLPTNAKINSTRVHAVFGSGLTGCAVKTVGGKVPGSDGFVTIDNPAVTDTSVNVEFKFQAYKDSSSAHDSSATTAKQTHNHTSISIVSEVYLLIDYDIVLSACGEPTSVTVSPATAAPGAKVRLSWSGASAGAGNAITGYQIYRSTNADSGYSLLTTVSANSTSGSTTVTAPTENGAVYYYKVLTLGTYSGYNSGQSSAYATLTCSYTATSAPTSVKLASTNVGPGVAVTLSWSGATAGTSNPIKGYEIYRATSANGDYALLDTVTTADTSSSASVAAPTENGVSYYYKVMTLGTVEDTDSALSTAYAVLTCTFSAPSAPTSVKVNDTSTLYVYPGTEVTLTWTGAADGANNNITGFTIWQNDTVLVNNLSPSVTSYTFTLPQTGGIVYAYTIVAQGEHSASQASEAAQVYAYTDPTAPDSVTSDPEPVAGSRVKLSWSGANPGGLNAITGYNIYRYTAVNGEGAYVATASTTETSGSYYVDAPSRATYKYYYRVETVCERSSSGISTAYATMTAKEDTSGTSADVVIKITPKPRRKKRKFLFGNYDTDLDGKWTVCEWSFTEPETQTTYVDVPGRLAGPLDMTAANTDGDPRYTSRSLTVRMESSEGTRLEREGIISRMLNRLHGYREEITMPDDQTRYAVGRISVAKDYNDMAHASVTVTATCEPWRYSKMETKLELEADESIRTTVLTNNGRMQVIPEITITGRNAGVILTVNDETTWALSEGTFSLPGLVLNHGYTKLSYTGSGTITIRYREAIL